MWNWEKPDRNSQGDRVHLREESWAAEWKVLGSGSSYSGTAVQERTSVHQHREHQQIQIAGLDWGFSRFFLFYLDKFNSYNQIFKSTTNTGVQLREVYENRVNANSEGHEHDLIELKDYN